jgi:cysteinyl-tRNA synthetase
MLNIFNTLKRKKEPFSPITSGEVSFYTCGPTVYNFAHIGNFRAYISADILRRWLIYGHSLNVHWVLNITDVDDKTIRHSQLEHSEMSPKKALKTFTRKYEDAFFEDLHALGIERSHFFANPRATEYIPQMQQLVRNIAKRGFVKNIQGSLFFDVKKWSKQHSYGQLLPIDFSKMKMGTRTLVDEMEKDDASDFVLWKAKKPEEPAWDFDFFGENIPGRPGWHLECSAMEKEIFGLPFDIHSGGVDLVFPHHENEIAQSSCGYDAEPTNYWVHNEHLLVDGAKMSKSLGNFYTLRDLLQKGHVPDALRMFLVIHHYRSKVNLTDEGIISSQNILNKGKNFLWETQHGDRGEECLRAPVLSLIEENKKNFEQSMNDDLSTPLAIASVHALITDLQSLSPFSEAEKKHITEVFSFFGNVFGVSFFPQSFRIPDHVISLAEERKKARAQKEWGKSDSLRKEIDSHGFEVRDIADHFEIFPKK